MASFSIRWLAVVLSNLGFTAGTVKPNLNSNKKHLKDVW
jgi:hypothetical protein